ncbi:hypothetical protein [Vulcanisaeta sp. JCM 16161]
MTVVFITIDVILVLTLIALLNMQSTQLLAGSWISDDELVNITM